MWSQEQKDGCDIHSYHAGERRDKPYSIAGRVHALWTCNSMDIDNRELAQHMHVKNTWKVSCSLWSSGFCQVQTSHQDFLRHKKTFISFLWKWDLSLAAAFGEETA